MPTNKKIVRVVQNGKHIKDDKCVIVKLPLNIDWQAVARKKQHNVNDNKVATLRAERTIKGPSA